jgi:hypothetical protein
VTHAARLLPRGALLVAVVTGLIGAPPAHAQQPESPFVYRDNTSVGAIGRANPPVPQFNQSFISAIPPRRTLSVAADSQHLY